MNHILVVDDEAEIRTSLEEILREEGYSVAGAASAAEALVLIQDAPYDVVLLDIWLPDRDGLEVLSDIRQLASETRPEVIIISGHGTIETAVKATKLGAYDFLEKPLSLDRTLIVVKNAVEARRLRTENQEFKRQFSVASVLTGESVPLKALRQDEPVLEHRVSRVRRAARDGGDRRNPRPHCPAGWSAAGGGARTKPIPRQRRNEHDALWPGDRGQPHPDHLAPVEAVERLRAPPRGHRPVECGAPAPQARPRDHAGEIRHQLHGHASSTRPARWCWSIRTAPCR